MIKLSNWYLEGYTDIEDTLENLLANREINNPIEWDLRPLTYRVVEKQDFPLDRIHEIEVEGDSVRFIYFNVVVEKLKRNWLPEQILEDRINVYQSDILIYQDGNKVRLIVMSSKTNSVRIIKSFFDQERWGGVVEENNIDKDLLYWVFYRLREFPNTQLIEDSGLYLTGLVSYMGKSKDEINAVRGQGVRVGALLGTLAFIFNDDNLKALKPEIQFNDHTIIAEINFNNAHKIDDASYRGEFIALDEECKIIALTILMCKTIVPRLEEAYSVSKELGEWSPQIKLVFLRNIGNTIAETVECQMNRIHEEIRNMEKGREEPEVDEEEFDLDLEALEEEMEDADI